MGLSRFPLHLKEATLELLLSEIWIVWTAVAVVHVVALPGAVDATFVVVFAAVAVAAARFEVQV